MLTSPLMNTGKHINMNINTFSKHIHTATTADREKYRYKFTQTGREYQHTETCVHVNTNTYMLFPTATQTHKYLQCTQLHTVIPVRRSRTMNLHCGAAKKGSEKWGYPGDFGQRSDSHPVLEPGRGKATVL